MSAFQARIPHQGASSMKKLSSFQWVQSVFLHCSGYRLLALAVLLLALTMTAAAQTGAETSQTETETPQTETETPRTEADPPPAEPAKSDASTAAPDDYRASRQISEDLSVSFPVDI